MSGSNRRDRGALVALAAILAAVVLIVIVTTWINNPLCRPVSGAQAQEQNDQRNQPVAPVVCSDADYHFFGDSWAQWLTAVFAIGATGISLYGLILIYRTWSETKRTADAAFAAVEIAKSSNAIASDTAKRQLRAYLGIERIDPQQFVAGKPPLFGIIIKNTGVTPAKRFRHAVFVSAHASGTARKYRTEDGDTRVFSSVDVGAGGNYVMIASADKLVTPELWEAVRSKRMTFEIAAYASYVDVFNERHLMTFRAFVDMTHGAVNVLASTRHNTSN